MLIYPLFHSIFTGYHSEINCLMIEKEKHLHNKKYKKISAENISPTDIKQSIFNIYAIYCDFYIIFPNFMPNLK